MVSIFFSILLLANTPKTCDAFNLFKLRKMLGNTRRIGRLDPPVPLRADVGWFHLLSYPFLFITRSSPKQITGHGFTSRAAVVAPRPRATSARAPATRRRRRAPATRRRRRAPATRATTASRPCAAPASRPRADSAAPSPIPELLQGTSPVLRGRREWCLDCGGPVLPAGDAIRHPATPVPRASTSAAAKQAAGRCQQRGGGFRCSGEVSDEVYIDVSDYI
jgi:hypothetical protein